MSNAELQAKWDEMFKNRPLNRELYQPGSYCDMIDEAYKNRIFYQNFKYKYDKEQERIARYKAEQREEQRAREEEQRAREEAEIKRTKFQNSLNSNEMVKEIITKINALKYQAFWVEVYTDEVRVLNEKEKEIISVKYVRFGYPKLENQQIIDLTDYLQNNLALKYIRINNNQLELSDAPGGMKKSW